MHQSFDIVIVGAGPAGCVLANRLSADPGRSVALIEAGPDYGSNADDWPAGLLDASSTHEETHNWELRHQPGLLADGLSLPRGRVVGGSSALNACLWMRCSAADYDEWAALGNSGWSFEDLLPYFRKAEADPIGGPLHGTDGMVPIYRVPPDRWTAVDRALIEAAASCGLDWIDDLNGSPEQKPGIGPSPRNAIDGVRMNGAFTYLKAARDRPNLTIIPDCLVDRVLIEDGTAVGVLTSDGETFRAGEVILSSGAYGSPAILLRSGIGPGEHLRELGIPVVRDLQGVGEHLLDHPNVGHTFEGVIAPGSTPESTTFLPLHIKARSRQVDNEIDLHIYQGQSHDEELGAWKLWFAASLQYARSKGTVRLASTDPSDPPLIDHNYFSDPADLEALCDCVELVRDLAGAAPLSEIIEPIPELTLTWTTRDELREKVKAQVGTTYHPSSTCRMGPASDPMSVVDQAGRVCGINGLRVVDASIFPTGPRGNLHFPVVAVAEKLADAIRNG